MTTYTYLESPLGQLLLTGSGEKLSGLYFVGCSHAQIHRDWVRQDEKQQAAPFDDADAKAITAHNWHDGSYLQLSNGNRVEKQGDAAFYIVDPGAPNQKTYTILYPKAD